VGVGSCYLERQGDAFGVHENMDFGSELAAIRGIRSLRYRPVRVTNRSYRLR
jgi:hypothetical protein